MGTLTGRGTGDGPSRILVGVDPSDTAMRAAAHALGTAGRQGSELVVLYVHRPASAGTGMAGAVALMDEATTQIGDDLEQLIRSDCEAAGVEITFLRRCGRPAVQLLRVAEEFHVDAITIGASTHLGHKLLGSLATRLVRSARWPITVVP